MTEVDFLVVGAGVTGLSFANRILERHPSASVLVVEREDEAGGYCRTIKREGFVWDYSGHFFHFKNPEVESWLRERMPDDDIRKVEKRSNIFIANTWVDFPFQKNIHQLPHNDFLDCLHDLVLKDEEDFDAAPNSFQEMVYRKFGRGIAERFLIPYNEKLYATSLNNLDKDAMGRFFPDADLKDIVRNMRAQNSESYNASFTYPSGGAMSYVHALLRDLPNDCVSLNEEVTHIDVEQKTATTNTRQIHYKHMVSAAPLPRLLDMTQTPFDQDALSWNKVLVFNLGFDKKGPRDIHWTYFPEKALRFYRVGFYDNIMKSERMSLYVEIGAAQNESFDIDAEKERVLADLKRAQIVDGHELIAWHALVLDPAYVHISKRGEAEASRVRQLLAAKNVHSAGRYGRWTYCSIEDNMIEARELADSIAY